MTKLAMTVPALLAGAITVGAVTAPTAAQADEQVAARLDVSDISVHDTRREARGMGERGQAGGVWAAYEVIPGFAGYQLVVWHRHADSPRAVPTYLYSAPAARDCAHTGAVGLRARVWTSFGCAGRHLFVR